MPEELYPPVSGNILGSVAGQQTAWLKGTDSLYHSDLQNWLVSLAFVHSSPLGAAENSAEVLSTNLHQVPSY